MTPRRLLVGAAILHVTLAVVLFAAGRGRIAPAVVSPDGIVDRAAPDSHLYQRTAIPLAEALGRGDVTAWVRRPAPLHVRAIAISFAFLSPLFGYSTLAAEPYNLVCYLAAVAVVFAIGREVGSARTGMNAAALVAVWPTFLFHTLQLLKDPLFIAGALALVYFMLTWVTTTYDWHRALREGAMLLIASGLVLLIRPKFVVAVIALIGVALAMLVARQVVERRLLLPNVGCAAAALAILSAAALSLSGSARPHEILKRFPTAETGDPKSAAAARVPTSVWHSAPRQGTWEGADRASLALGSLRSRFAYSSRGGGSGIDDTVVFLSARDLVAYLPRAAAIGLWAPFPAIWLTLGQSVGLSGRLLAAIETLAIYACEAFAIAALLLPPRRMGAALLLLIAAIGVTGEALVVANLGALYRFRLSFWLLLIVLGVVGLAKLRPKWAPTIAVLLAVFTASCAPSSGPPRTDTTRVANITGFQVQAIYLSPRDARTWQENILGGSVLDDGQAVDVRFPPAAKSLVWDLRVDGVNGYRGEWSGVDLSTVSTLTLRIAHDTLVADLEVQR